MPKILLGILALGGALGLAACSNTQPAETAATTTPVETPAAAPAPEPDHPQPVVVVPPRPTPGAPHGPGFDMPLIDLEGYAPARPMEVVRDAYVFTADHPDVSSYVPCYCGCANAGHKNNTDCFVRARDAEGRVTEWEPHGVVCAMCIDIAVDSMKMRNSGASVTAIRRKIQGDYRPRFPTSETPTPAPPQQGN